MIKALGLFYTFACTATCKMCVTNSSPFRKEKMSFEEAKKYIQETASLSSIGWISLNGGEPLLYYEEICKLLKFAKTIGKKTKISTNGFWAEDHRTAKDIIRQLERAGLDFISLSTDVYHTEFIGFENIKYCLEAIEGSGLMRELTIVVDRKTQKEALKLAQSLGEKNKLPTYGKVMFFNENTALEDLKCHTAINIAPLQPFGRGIGLLDQCFFQKFEKYRNKPCSVVGRYPYVMPGGEIYWCCNFFRPERGYVKNFRLGTFKCDSLIDIEQKLQENPLVNFLSTQGPGNFPWKPFLSADDQIYQDEFASMCHLCIAMFTKKAKPYLQKEQT